MPPLLLKLLVWLLQLDPTQRPTPQQLRECPLLLPDVLSAAVFEEKLLPTMAVEEVVTYEEFVAAFCCCRAPQLDAELELGKPADTGGRRGE
jgi:hypothetical protein